MSPRVSNKEETTKRFVSFGIMVVVIACALSLGVTQARAVGKANKGYQMHGEITAIIGNA